MLGDFNVDLLNDKHVEEAGVGNFCTNSELFQLIHEPTRPISGTILDHIYTNVHNVFESGLINFHISDHTPIYMILKCARTKVVKKCIKARSYRRYDFLTYKNSLLHINWNDIVTLHDPNEMWIRILFNMKACLDVMCPIRKLTIPEYTPEWLTPPIIDAMRNRDDRYRVARQTNSTDNWNMHQLHCE